MIFYQYRNTDIDGLNAQYSCPSKEEVKGFVRLELKKFIKDVDKSFECFFAIKNAFGEPIVKTIAQTKQRSEMLFVQLMAEHGIDWSTYKYKAHPYKGSMYTIHEASEKQVHEGYKKLMESMENKK